MSTRKPRTGLVSTVHVLLLVALGCVPQLCAAAGRQWTADELLTLSFPYQSSNDAGLDVCKAGELDGVRALVLCCV